MALDSTYTEDKAESVKAQRAEREAIAEDLRKEYRLIQDSPAFKDLLRELDEQYQTAFNTGGASVDNLAKQASYGQRAYMCDIIRAYIRDKIS